MSSAMKFEEYLRQQAERGQFGVALIESEIALGIADWIELHRDAVPVVRCKDCKYRIVNEHYGERGYMKLKAYCDLDTGDPFELGRNAEDDNWFCADGERRSEDEDHT